MTKEDLVKQIMNYAALRVMASSSEDEGVKTSIANKAAELLNIIQGQLDENYYHDFPEFFDTSRPMF